MKTIKITVFLLIPILFIGCNNNKKSVNKIDEIKTVVPIQKKQDSPNNNILKDASSPYEDLVEFALTKNTAEIDKTLSKIQADKLKVMTLLEGPKKAQFNTFVENISNTRNKDNFDGVALNATEAYKTIISGLDDEGLVVPKQVSYLDYVGFKLLAQLNAANTDWNATQQTVTAAVEYWDIIKVDVKKDKALNNLMLVTIEGLQKAQKLKNIDMLLFAAQVDLEAVDLLEGFYEGN